MLGSAPLVAILATTDRDRAREFYGETLGLELLREEPIALAFSSGGSTLRIFVGDEVGHTSHAAVGWTTEDVAATVSELRARNVEIVDLAGLDQDASGIWTSPGGARVAWFRDPDGNMLSVTQPPAR